MKFLFILIGLISAFVVFNFYASFIHNQHFSNIAALDKNIKTGQACNQVLSILEKYQLSSSSEVFVNKTDIGSTPQWIHRKEVVSTISVSDLSTPFDTINYYVFCNSKDTVLNTLLAGD